MRKPLQYADMTTADKLQTRLLLYRTHNTLSAPVTLTSIHELVDVHAYQNELSRSWLSKVTALQTRQKTLPFASGLACRTHAYFEEFARC